MRRPESTGRPDLWERAVCVIRREPPDHRPCFRHRNVRPGIVLFIGRGAGLRSTGVVDCDAGKAGTPWREVGRDDLTSDLPASRLEGCLQELFRTFG